MNRVLVCVFLAIAISAASAAPADESFWNWSLSKAVKLLNTSAWARQETFTTVVGGVGSGRAGEKEIYNRFYVRFLSAMPIREAYARILQIEHGYDELEVDGKRQFDDMLQPVLAMDVDSWIVVSVGFRSNDPDMESQVRRFFQSETTATLRDKAFLSTDDFSQIRVQAYFPPLEEGVGAKFVFPRNIDGVPLISADKGRISFELLDIPIARPGGSGGGSPRGRGRGGGGRSYGGGGGGSGGPGGNTNNPTILRSTFSIEDMFVDGKLIL